MKRFLIFVKKETLQILRDYRTMLIVILMPAVQIILFGFALSTEVNNVDVAIYAPQRGNTARRIADRIAANPYMNFKGYIKSTDEIDKKMRNGNIDIAIAIDNGIDKVEAGKYCIRIRHVDNQRRDWRSGNAHRDRDTDALQSAASKLIHLCSRHSRLHHPDNLRNDNVNINRAGKRDRHNRHAACISSTPNRSDRSKISTLFRAVVRQSCHYSDSCQVPAWRAYARKRPADMRHLPAIHRYVARIRHTCFYNFQKPDNGDTDMRRGDDNPGDYAFGTHIPYREHPGGIAIPVVHRPCTLVYRSNAQTDD